MDWVVGLPSELRYGQSFGAILVVTDRATKMVHLIPTSKTEFAEDTARLLVANVFKLHGLPRSIHSDIDTRLTSRTWAEICEILRIRSRHTIAWHPQANGKAERSNLTMKRLLRIAYQAFQSWYDVLSAAELGNNNAPLSPHSYSPFSLNHGFHPCTILDVFTQHEIENEVPEDPTTFSNRLMAEWKVVHAWLNEHRKTTAVQANKNSLPHSLEVGDFALINLKTAPSAPRSDQGLHYHTKKVENLGKLIPSRNSSLAKRAKMHGVFHSSQFRPYHSAQPSSHDVIPESQDPEE